MNDDAEIPCTAFVSTATNERNALFTPPCACPRCAPTPAVEAEAPATIWLQVDGRPVRRDVERLDLGRVGHDVLG